MNQMKSIETYGELIEPATLKIERLLPGPIERIWSYLTDSELRQQWLAAGTMEMRQGATFELTWRNDELTDPPGAKPAGFGGEHRMQSRIVEFVPPRKLTIAWSGSGDVSFELAPKGNDVLLTIIHHRLPDRRTLLMHAAGWHVHLDLLTARVTASKPEPFWDGFVRLMADYESRLPA